MALTKITKTGIGNDAVNSSDKLADGVISEEHLDATVVTGLSDLGSNVASGDTIIVYDTSAGALKKISQTNFLNFPVVSTVSPTNVLTGDGTGNHTFVVTGTGFTGAEGKFVNASGTVINADTNTVDSPTQITLVVAKSSLPGSGEPYDVRVVAASGLTSTLENQINIDQAPTFNTSAGSLGSVADATSGNFTVEAFDPESAGNLTFDKKSGTIPPGMSTSTVHENGVSKFKITGTPTSVGSDTTFNFTIRAADAASNQSSRDFSIIVQGPRVQSFTSSGTFSVPSGVSSVDVLVVAGGGAGVDQHGGGGGAGGLIFMPGYPVTPGGTVSVTVGCGGQGQAAPITDSTGTPTAMIGQDSVFGTLTAKGGGGGGNYSNINDARINGDAGGSGGGGGNFSSTGQVGSAGSATQPTQPGNSGAYGFGNAGGAGGYHNGNYLGGGGGGAGAAGNIPSPITVFTRAGNGGIGKEYTIADGTTPVYYAGGGGGGRHDTPNAASDPTNGAGGVGGQGGGGPGNTGPRHQCTPSPVVDGVSGQANKGGGGGSGGNHSNSTGTPSPTGGKGIVIVRWT